MLVATPVSATDSSNQEKLVAELDALRQDSIAVARETQQHQGRLGALDRELVLLGQDAAARRRGLEESRVEQAQLLGALERLARHPPDQTPPQPGTPLDQARSRILLAATVPALRAEGRALAGEIEAAAALRARLSARQNDLIELRDALAHDRARLAEISSRRPELVRQLLPDMGKGASQPAKSGAGEADLGELIA